MVLDKIPNTQLFTQRDVRETPATTATATAVGLTDLNYILISTDADTTRDRVITAGEGIDFDDGGAKSTFTIKGEDASETNKGIIEIATINEVQTGTDEDRAVVPNSLQVVIPPVGAIVAWAKSIAGVPQTLPAGWRLCNGSTINDAESPMNGEDVPDLNGGEFLRGAETSGGTGGSDTIDNHAALNISNDSHTHTVSGTTSDEGAKTVAVQSGSGQIVTDDDHTHTWSDTSSQDTHDHGFSQNIDAHSTNLPSYYNVVWIIRFK